MTQLWFFKEVDLLTRLFYIIFESERMLGEWKETVLETVLVPIH